MDESKFQRDEYEIEHYGFSAKQFIAEFRNSIFETVRFNMTDIKESIGRKLNLNDEEKDTLDKDIENLIGKYKTNITERLIPIESAIHDFFAIPENVCLKNYNTEVEDCDLESIEQEIKELESKYKKGLMMQMIMQDELEEAKKLNSAYQFVEETLLKMIQFPTVEKLRLRSEWLEQVCTQLDESYSNTYPILEFRHLFKCINNDCSIHTTHK